MLRVFAGTTTGGLLGLFVAANWLDPKAVMAGVVIGAASVMVGFVCGITWADSADRRKAARSSSPRG